MDSGNRRMDNSPAHDTYIISLQPSLPCNRVVWKGAFGSQLFGLQTWCVMQD